MFSRSLKSCVRVYVSCESGKQNIVINQEVRAEGTGDW